MNKLVAVVILTALFFYECSEKKAIQESSKATDSVEVFALRKDTVFKTLSLPGELYPWERAELYAKAEGYVREVKVDIGDRVRKNDIVAILDAPEITANYAKSIADQETAHARYKTSMDNYRRTIQAAAEQGAVSGGDMQRIKNQMLSDSASFKAAQAATDSYAQLKSYLIIRAPFDGVITQRNVDPGMLAGEGKKPLYVLENLSKLRLHVAVPEAYSSAVPLSPAMTFGVDAMPSKKFSASLTRTSKRIDPKTRSEIWELVVANANNELKSGMYCSAELALKRREPSFVIPFTATVTNLERSFVIRVRDNKTEWVNIRQGIATPNGVEIFGDLAPDDKLVKKATDELKPGRSVISFVSSAHP